MWGLGRQTAARCVEVRSSAPVMASASAQAWALKAACYAAWQRDPPACRGAANELAALAQQHPQDTELQALAAWTDGIAALAISDLPVALQRLQAAQALFEARGQPGQAAETRVPQIGVLSMLGREGEARQCAEGALAQFDAAGDQRSAGKVELNLGSVLFRQDRHAEAEKHFRRAALRFARTGDAELSISADVALANLLGWQFRFDEALQMYERARLRARARGLQVLLVQVHQGVGQIELHRGHWARALRELSLGAQLARSTGAPPQRRIEAEAALADAYLAARLLTEATLLYDTLVQQAEALDLPTEQAWATLQRARAWNLQARTEEAQRGFAAAATLYEALGNQPVLGLIALEQGRLALDAGFLAVAAERAQCAQNMLAPSGLLGWQLQARLLAADADAAAGRWAPAEATYREVLAQALGPPVWPQWAGPCWAGLGDLARARGDMPGARQAYEQALGLVEQLRAALPDDDMRSAVAATASTVHEALVSLSLAHGDTLTLLVDLERGRGRGLALSLAGGGKPQRESARLQWLRQQWRQTLSEGDTARGPALAAQVQNLEQALLEEHRRERLQDRPGALGAHSSGSVFAAADVPALQAMLGLDRAMVAYHWQGDTLLACVVTSEGLEHRSWPVPGLGAQIRALRFQLDTLRHGDAVASRHGALLQDRVRQRLQAVYAQVWAPLVPMLAGRRRCVVLPHRELHYVPLSALHDGRCWLVAHTELALAPSAAVWLALQRRPPPSYRRACVVGVGDDHLPQVAQEARQVAAIFGSHAQLLLDGEATRAALQSSVGSADVLHLACHGEFRADNPAFSALWLADGPLTLLDLSQQRLPAGLVALSACETGASRIASGEELQGLVRSCFQAGTAAVLATLWPVEDTASAALMVRFYEELHRGQSAAAALRAAQLAAASSDQHPYFWAGFVLHGRG